MATGDNLAGEDGPSDPDDLRGKILRIRPLPQGGYAIPEGNLFPPGTPGARPEIYAMGVRNPFTLHYDRTGRRLAFGDMGPDHGGLHEELNLAAGPGHFGWPHFAGLNLPLEPWKDPLSPARTKPLPVPAALVPAPLPAVHAYRQSAAVTGPVFRAPAHPGPAEPLARGALPGSFDGLWFVTDWNMGRVDTLRLSPDGARVVAQGPLQGVRLDRPNELRLGPDGALYAINYGNNWFATAPSTSLVRIDFTACPTGLAGAGRAGPMPGLRGGRLEVAGPHAVTLRDAAGRLVYGARKEGTAVHDLAGAAGGRRGVYLVEMESTSGRAAWKAVL